MTPPPPAPATTPTDVALWVGGYGLEGPDGPADGGEGVWRVVLDAGTGALRGELAAATPAPSFVALAPDGRTLYAVGETEDGTVSAFAVADDGGLTLRARVSSGGAYPCHLLVDAAGRAVYVANYASGSLAVLTLDADGGFSPEVLEAGGPVQVHAHTGSGPVADRQEGPHTHSAFLAPGGRHVVAADLGADALVRYRVADDGTLVPDGVATALPPGTGPRHLAATPERVVVVGELDNAVHLLDWDAESGTGTPVASVTAATGKRRSGEGVLPAHVVVSGTEVVVSVRGADVVSRFAVDPAYGPLAPRGETWVGGSWPRHFALVEDAAHPAAWVVVAAQEEGLVTVLPRSRATGEIGEPVARLAVPYPACVVPA